jgi:hypothetical protein
MAPKELGLGPSLTAAAAYETGYALKPDRREKFPWNSNVDQVLEMDPAEAEAFFLTFFDKYDGQFELSRPGAGGA